MRRVFAERGRAALADVPEPQPRAGEVLVRTVSSTVSTGTELSILNRSADPDGRDVEYPGEGPYVYPNIRSWVGDTPSPRPSEPGRMSLGYSLAGHVIGLGAGITDLAVGDLVACAGSQGAHHADVVAVTRNLVVRVPDGVTPEQAAFVTPGAVAVEALRRTGCRFGETVVVFGLGLLGLLAGQIARAAGLYVVGFELDLRRLELAGDLGLTDVFDPRAVDPLEVVRSRTAGFGADAVILGVVTESSEPLNLALDLCRQRGRVVGLGVFGMNIERGRMFDRTYLQTVAIGPGRYDPSYEEGNVDYPVGYVRWTENRNMEHFVRLLAEGAVRTSPLAVTYALNDAPAAYEALKSPGRPPTVQFSYGR